MGKMGDYQTILSLDISRVQIGTKVRMIGEITKKDKNPKKILISLTDITGTVRVTVLKSSTPDQTALLKVGKRVRISGVVRTNNEGKRIITDVDLVEAIGEIANGADIDILDQESLILSSKISNLIRKELEKEEFLEISTRVISRYLGEEILEPLLAKFPGFGSEIYLSPSPSSQLSEFLITTLLPRVFTESISFTTSYRFKNASSEMPLIMAKAINMSQEETQRLIVSLTDSIFKELVGHRIPIKIYDEEWSESLDDLQYNIDGITYMKYKANIPVVGEKWNSVVDTIIRITDNDGNVLIEGADEVISESTSLVTFTFFPTQFLNIVNRAPKRILHNLWEIYDGVKLYN